MKKQSWIVLGLLTFLLSFCSPPAEKGDSGKDERVDKTIAIETGKKSELEETAIQINEIDNDTQLEDQTGILVVRFLLDTTSENKLEKLPNFRIKGPKALLIDNTPSSIQKDAIHVYKVPAGTYSISSLYSINSVGEYEFDKPFPPNSFVVEKGAINYIGDIRVRMEEEKKSANLITRKLKLKLPANNDETIQVIEDRLKSLIQKYPLERKIISF